MSHLQLNKSSLAKCEKDLASFTRFLPSLELKQQQLMAEMVNTSNLILSLKEQLEALIESVKIKLPMLANQDVQVEQLVAVDSFETQDRNVVGVHLPYIERLEIKALPYSLLTKPHWVDSYVVMQTQAITLSLEINIAETRKALLKKAVTTITQRINLFEKVLIPQTKQNIKKIKLFLSDQQMVTVVRSKIAKRKRMQGQQAL